MTPPEILYTDVRDITPDMGPKHRSGLLVIFLSTIALIGAVAGFAIMRRYVPSCGSYAWIVPVGLGALSLLGWWRTYTVHRDYCKTPLSHAVLAGELGFDLLCTCRDVAMTAFFKPDICVPGGTMKFFLFVENYASRQRVVHVRIGRLLGLNRPQREFLRLHLAAGQAAVYCVPVRVAKDIIPGAHRLTVTLHVSCPSGAGQRLEGTRSHLYDIDKCRYTAPFKVTESSKGSEVVSDEQALAKPSYISLASISEKAPTLEKLRQMVDAQGQA